MEYFWKFWSKFLAICGKDSKIKVVMRKRENASEGGLIIPSLFLQSKRTFGSRSKKNAAFRFGRG